MVQFEILHLSDYLPSNKNYRELNHSLSKLVFNFRKMLFGWAPLC